jgi:hypothetical protein
MTPSTTKSGVVCTIATGPHLEMYDVTGPSLARYAARYGYDFVPVHERLSLARPPAWDKVELLRALVDEYDLVFWVDDDAIVLADAPDIATALRPNAFMHLVEHRTDVGRVPNSGVVALRGGKRSARFLETVWNQTQFIHDKWWENAAIIRLLGYRNIPTRGLQPVVPSPWRIGCSFIDGRWNSIAESPAPDPYIVHFPGIPLPDRIAQLRALVPVGA